MSTQKYVVIQARIKATTLANVTDWLIERDIDISMMTRGTMTRWLFEAAEEQSKKKYQLESDALNFITHVFGKSLIDKHSTAFIHQGNNVFDEQIDQAKIRMKMDKVRAIHARLDSGEIDGVESEKLLDELLGKVE